jgi:GNAT superfamily N-acetyltransferase
MLRSLSCPVCGSARLERVRAEPASEFLCVVCRALTERPPRATLAARVVTRVRRDGFRRVVGLVGRRVIDVRRYVVYVVPSAGAAAIDLPAGVEIDDLRPDDLDGLASIVPRSELQGRLDQGELGIVARAEGLPVGCVWLAPGLRRRRFPLPIELGPGEVYADGLFVARSKRNRGVGTALSRARRARAQSLGFHSVVAHAHVENLRARRIQEAQGAVPREAVVLVTLLGRWRVARDTQVIGNGPATDRASSTH